ncbi:S8 family serine peptidase [Micromonospora sp. LOL_024]|uniref:S8 family serine peptidase n=1 Tax=Micromonospora sp. LOL_024 TaxID=3345412 RepID=UPI003A898BAE
MNGITRPATVPALAAASVLVALSLPATPAAADSTRDDSWHVKALELPEMHRITQGEGVVVAVIDTGVDGRHQDLRDNVLPGVDLHDDGTKGRIDRAGHGTGMASLIAGHGHGPGNRDGVLGVAPRAKILPVTIKSEQSPLIAPTAVAAGINWAVDNGADIVNVSLGSSFSEELNRAVDRAYQRNVIVVAAVGNRGDSLISNPARQQTAVAVNGTDRKGVISEEAALPAREVDISAPGEEIIQAAPGDKYVTAIGSSGSAAIVSGALALIKAEYPDLNGYEMFRRLLETTRDEGDPGHDLYYGWGALDIRQALTGEPDGRGTRSFDAGPKAGGAEPWQANPREREDDILIFVWAVIIAVLVLIIGGIVATAMLIRSRARQRQAMSVDETTPTLVTTTPGPDTPPMTQATDADQPPDAAGDGVWRPPPG